MHEAWVSVSNVSVSFPLYHASSRSLKKTMIAAASNRLGRDGQDRVVVQALQHINLDLRGGDRLGLIGQNGAGKTTLLRTLAGIYEPVVGQVDVRGSVNALLDPSLGMNFDLTGRENILLRGLYNGLQRDSLAQLERDVSDFAGLGDFLELPMRTYSSGMVVRLGFALATALRPQVLLMDEWILAGDAHFRELAQRRLECMIRNARILVISTHDMEVVRTWCSRALWLDQGRIRAEGPAGDIVDQYLSSH